MKLIGVFFALFLAVLPREGEGIAVLKRVRCEEAVDDSNYSGNRCTVSNITLPETVYNWGRVTHPEIHFTNSTIPFLPERLEEMMKQFIIMNMTGVKLEILIQGNLKNAMNLKTLHLKQNLLTMLANETFSAASALEFLDVSFNDISMIEAAAFVNLKKLTHLDLSHNHLKVVGVEFQDLTNLAVLKLSNNHIQSIHPNVIGVLPNINTVSLEFNHLQDLSINVCHEFNLNLILGSNRMKSVVVNWNPVCRMGLQNKLEIIAPDNRIVRIGTDKQINLIHVDLQRNGLSSIIGIKRMVNLRRLNLAGNNITNVSLEILRTLTNLSEFDLSENSIETLNVTNICEYLPSLTWLGLSGNHWESCEYLSDIVTILKQAKIEVDLSCVVIETEESTEKDDTITTDKSTTTPEHIPTPPIDDDDRGELIDNGNKILEFLKSDYLNLVVAVLLIFVIIAIIVKIYLDCKYRRRVHLHSDGGYLNGGTIGTRM